MNRAIKDYWNRKIKIWSDTSYNREGKTRGILNKVFQILRKSIDERLQTALQILQPHIKGKSILDLGCGTGNLGFALMERGCSQYIGLDISEVAIEECRRKAASLGLNDKMIFICSNLFDDDSLPQADITTGLGLLDWLHPHDVERLISLMKNHRFLFSYSEQDNSLSEFIHRLYLVKRLQWKNTGVYAYHFKRQFIVNILKKNTMNNVTFMKNKKMRFGVIIHNLND
jgi:2-polyprenyl-3-methyl-5-hydroxy-6-metoxy-1,4-benzoquinol methylase